MYLILDLGMLHDDVLGNELAGFELLLAGEADPDLLLPHSFLT